MKAKLAFIVGLGVGYVAGTRVGRGGYDSLKSNARSLWKSDAVQETINTLEDSVKTEAKDLGSKLVHKVSGNVTAGQDKSSLAAGGRRTAPVPDVNSDPALNTDVGQDWSDEGGALPSGPAS